MSIEHAIHPEVEHYIAGVPEELQAFPHFVVWKPIEVKGRLTKPPINPTTGSFADSTDPHTWGSFNQALRAMSSGRYAGIGFVFAEDDPFTGTDLDHCVTDTGIESWAREIITTLDSYTEYSPSGKGLHIITEAHIPKGRRKDNTEMYSTERYFTLTAHHLPGTPDAILPRQQEQERLYQSLAGVQHPAAIEMHPRIAYRLSQDDEVVEKAIAAKNGKQFRALWQGDIAGFRSKSEADFTLVLRLLYWTNDDVAQTKRLFRQSGLCDPEKTDAPRGKSTYLDVTVENALRKRKYR